MENCHKTIEKSTFDNPKVQKTIEKPRLYKHHSPEIIRKPNKIIQSVAKSSIGVHATGKHEAYVPKTRTMAMPIAQNNEETACAPTSHTD